MNGQQAGSINAIGLPAALAALAFVLSGCAFSDAGSEPQHAGAPAHAAALLSEDEATDKAIAYLRNTDYGEGRIEVLVAIKTKLLMTSGRNDCGAIVRPVWAFQVHAKYDGWLYLDATTGEKACSSLPFLR